MAGGRYKAIIFDLGRVLVHFDFTRGYRALEGLCPYAAPDIPKRIATTDLVQRFETGLVEPAEFHRSFCELLGLRADYDHFCEIWASIFTDALLPESMLERLSERHRLLLLSNTNAIHFEMIRRTYAPLLRPFHHLVLSYEVNALKPNVAIYRAALKAAGCAPGECFYTDDIPEFVAGAREVGIDAVQFESAEQLQREMDARGIEWR